MRLHRLTLPIAVALIFLVIGCSSNDDKDNPAGTTGPTVAELDDAMEKTERQLDYYNQGAALSAVMDTTAAIDSLASLLRADPDVEWVNTIHSGVNIRWKSGREGIITLRLLLGEQSGKRGAAQWTTPGATIPTRNGVVPLDKTFSGGYHMPKNKKTLHLSPCYAQWESTDDEVNDTSAAAFARAGYEPFTFYKDEEVTLNVLRSIASGGYGVVRLCSHGSPWPTMEDVQEVYFVTGDTPTRESFIENWEAIEAYDLKSGAWAGTKSYYMNSRYFASHNDFGEDYPLIGLSFCFGYRGYWPGDLMVQSKAGGVFGWDYAVRSAEEADWFRTMIRLMCDTTLTYPTTLKRAHATGDTSYTETDGRVVSFHATSVVDSFGLWEPFRIDSLVPDSGVEGDTITINGVGFGESGNRSVWFSDQWAETISWTDQQIMTIVPAELEGDVFVYVKADDETSNQVLFSAGSDTLLALLQTQVELWIRSYGDFRHTGDDEIWEIVTFDAFVSDLQWNGVEFSAERNQVWSNGTCLETLVGTVSESGRTIVTLTYTVDSDITVPGEQEGFVREHIETVITDLDFKELVDGVPMYFVEGPEMQNHVTYTLWRSQQDSNLGDPVLTCEYTHVNWNSSSEPPQLKVYIGVAPPWRKH